MYHTEPPAEPFHAVHETSRGESPRVSEHDEEHWREIRRRAWRSRARHRAARPFRYSTVTDFARFRGWSTFDPRFTAM